MSRNFELLQRIEQERDMDDSKAAKVHQAFGLPDSLAATSSKAELKTPKIQQSEHKHLAVLVERLFLDVNAPKAVVFSAVNPGDGCSWIASRVAVQLAAMVCGSVCLVDGNISSPTLHRQFGVENSILSKDSSFQRTSTLNSAQQVSPANLWLTESPSQVVSSDGRSLISASASVNKLRSQYDYVVIDAPALQLGPEAILLAQGADGIVVVVGANSSCREVCRRVAREIQLSKVRILGTVLNKQVCPVPALIERRLQQYLGTTDL
jgi:Mrp family chromosome partitioning ATPase